MNHVYKLFFVALSFASLLKSEPIQYFDEKMRPVDPRTILDEADLTPEDRSTLEKLKNSEYYRHFLKKAGGRLRFYKYMVNRDSQERRQISEEVTTQGHGTSHTTATWGNSKTEQDPDTQTRSVFQTIYHRARQLTDNFELLRQRAIDAIAWRKWTCIGLPILTAVGDFLILPASVAQQNNAGVIPKLQHTPGILTAIVGALGATGYYFLYHLPRQRYEQASEQEYLEQRERMPYKECDQL